MIPNKSDIFGAILFLRLMTSHHSLLYLIYCMIFASFYFLVDDTLELNCLCFVVLEFNIRE